MAPKLNDSSEGKFVFVGAPTLKDQPGNIRSNLARRFLLEKRAKRRQDAIEELNDLLARGQHPGASGLEEAGEEEIEAYEDASSTYPPSQGSDSRESSNLFRPIKPKRGYDGGAPGPLGTGTQPQTIYRRSARSPSPPTIQFLGAGVLDPLLPLDAESSRLKVQELLHFACTTIWPHFRPLSYAAECYKAWALPYDNKVIRYAVLWASSYHRDILRITYGASEPQLESKEQLELKGLALKSLREEVANMSRLKSPDAIVMCILYLAVNDTHRARITRDSSPFSPPFRSLHALDFYGSRDYHPLHWSVVQSIVRRFGGIETLQAFALAWLLCISDLMNAVHNLHKPIYPIMLSVDGKRLDLDLQHPLLLFQSQSRHFARETTGSGFRELRGIFPPVKEEIVTSFVHLGELSCVLQYYSGETCSPVVLDLLGDSRNLVHHRLLSLPDENDAMELILECLGQSLDQTILSREIYLTCRLSAMLYAIHVTFPIPRSRLLREHIIKCLVPKIEWLMAQNVPSSRRLLLWGLSVAMITLENKCERLTPHTHLLCVELGVDTLERLLVLLRSFAWVDAAVQDRCKGMWKRIFPS